MQDTAKKSDDRSRVKGVNKLIQDGARPVMEVKDIIEALNLFMIPQQIEMQTALLSHEPCQIDDLIRESDLPAMTVSSTLTMMELKGIIRQVGGMQYVLARWLSGNIVGRAARSPLSRERI